MSAYLQQLSVLYVEDEADIREGYCRTLKRHFKETYSASNGFEGLALYKQYWPDIVITDIRMPECSGIEMSKEILSLRPEQIIVFTTAHSESEYTLEALELRISAYILKPVEKNKLIEKLSKLAENLIQQRETRQHQETIQNMLNNPSNLLILTDLTQVTFASPGFFDLFGVKDKEAFHDRFRTFLDIFDSSEIPSHLSIKEDFLNHTLLDKDPDKIVAILTQEGMRNYHIKVTQVGKAQTWYLVTMWDVTNIYHEKIDAEHKANHDELTQVFSRVRFNEFYHQEFLRALRYKRALSLAVLDIDHFKAINDTFGHLVGDEVLKTLANFCQKNIRNTDFLSRWGGEEFVLILSETPIEDAFVVCEKLRIGLMELQFTKNIPVTISIGLSQLQPGDSKESLLRRADNALFKAKQLGRNQVNINA
ncbi:GGDEF domain-containing response regulator [Sulfurospirillum sp. 1612]|uniref:GGDEF domain-containing response regulator n=1 Tax=Sulfurospirillum sp. 1612 TaxID=3094835 RepID=UPI002F93588E